MLLNRLFLCFLAASCALTLHCSRSDVITDAGGGVVSDMDSSLTDVGRGFALIRLDAGAVDSAFSLPAGADPAFSTQVLGYALVGVSGDGDTLAAHAQYRARAFAFESGSALYGGDDSLVGAYLYFRADGEQADPIAVYTSDTLVGLAPVNPSDRRVFVSDSGESPADNRIGAVTLVEAVDSVRLPDSLARLIFDTRISSDTVSALSVCSFAFSMFGDGDELRKFGSPYVIVHVRKNDKDGKVVRDSISGVARFTVFERDGAARAKAPYSSYYTLRTAVFRVNLRDVVDTLRSLDTLWSRNMSGGEPVNAVIAVRCNRDGADSSGGGSGAFVSSKVGNYKIVALDTLVTKEIPADSADVSLRGKFGPASSSKPDAPYNAHDVRAAVRAAVKKHNGERERVGAAAVPYIYVYLRPVEEGSTMVWDKPLKVETVFTPSRSQNGK